MHSLKHKIILSALLLTLPATPCMAAETSSEFTDAYNSIMEAAAAAGLTTGSTQEAGEESTEETTEENTQDVSLTESSTASLGEEDTEATEENTSSLSSSYESTIDWETLSQNIQDLGAFSSEFLNLYSDSVISGSTTDSFSELFSQLTGTEVSQDSLFDVSSFGTGLDTGAVNLQYEELCDSMLSQADSIDASGNAQTAQDVFESAYGDLASSLELEEAEIPSSFDPDSMLSSAQNSIDSAYKEAMSSDSFQTVKNSLDVSSIFEKASEGVNVQSLDSASSLKSSISSISESNKSTIEGEYSNASSKVSSALKSAKSNVSAQSSSNKRTYDYKSSENSQKVADSDTGLFDSLLDTDNASSGSSSEEPPENGNYSITGNTWAQNGKVTIKDNDTGETYVISGIKNQSDYNELKEKYGID